MLVLKSSPLRLLNRGLATATAHPPHASLAPSSHPTAAATVIPLSNVEAQWATLSPVEQAAVHQQLEELQRKDWKSLSLSEKKAGTSICSLCTHYLLLTLPSLLCRVWPSWTSRTGEPTRYNHQNPCWCFCPRRYCRAPLCGHPSHR
jgi:hypothetical protein